MWKSSKLGAIGLIVLTGSCASSTGHSNPPGTSGGSGATAATGTGATAATGTGATGAISPWSGGSTACVAGYLGCTCDPSGNCAAGLACSNGHCCDTATGSCAPPPGTGGSANGTGGSAFGTGGATTVCSVGTQGCSCTSQQLCASGLACSNGLCCSGSNCQVPTPGAGGSGPIFTGTGGALACLSGMQGCPCLQGKCAAGLTCTNNLCCNKTNCQMPPPPTNTGGTTGAGGASGQCAPGVIGPVLTDCGYPYSSSNPLTSVDFNESEVLAAIQPVGGSPLAAVRLFYNDEWAMTLGVRSVQVTTSAGITTRDYPVSPLPASPGSVLFPQTGTNELVGNFSGLDQWLRPMWPALFVTDITNDPNDRSGDWQQGGRPWNPSAVYGTWKGAVRKVDTTVTPASITIEPDANPGKNTWELGPGADPVPMAQITKKTEGFSAEVIWYLSLVPGHSYRIQVMVHDGDMNKVGGDVGEACLNFCAGESESDGGLPPPPDGGTDAGDSGPCPPDTIACGPGTGVICPEGQVCSLGCCLWVQ